MCFSQNRKAGSGPEDQYSDSALLDSPEVKINPLMSCIHNTGAILGLLICLVYAALNDYNTLLRQTLQKAGFFFYIYLANLSQMVGG